MEWNKRDGLSEQASKIINSEYATRKDMRELSKIEFNMAVVAKQASVLAIQQEEKYNLTKSNTTLEERSRKKSITEATEIGKYVAEKECGDYRSMKEDVKGMWQVIASVRGFKIAVYSSEKENDEMMGANYTGLDS